MKKLLILIASVGLLSACSQGTNQGASGNAGVSGTNSAMGKYQSTTNSAPAASTTAKVQSASTSTNTVQKSK